MIVRARPYAAGRVPVPCAADLLLAALVHTDAALAREYGTSVAVVRSWIADAKAGRELVASAYVPTTAEIHEKARRLLSRGLDLLEIEIEHATGKERLAIVREARECCAALGVVAPEPTLEDVPDDAALLDRFQRVTATGPYAVH